MPSAARLLVMSALAVAGVVSAATAAGVYAATDPQRRAAVIPPYSTAELLTSEPFRALSALVDSIVAPLGTPARLDSADLSHFVALTAHPSNKTAWIAEPDAFPAPTLRLTVSNRDLALYRSWARSAPLPAFWGYREGFGDPINARHLPIRRYAVHRAMWRANAAVADSLLARGDVANALVRARENVAGARHLIAQPLDTDVLIGSAQLKEGAKLLQRVARRGHDVELARVADRLLAGTVASHPSVRAPKASWSRAAADPTRDSLLRVAADTSVHPASRLLMATLLPSGVCFNSREMLFGVSDARQEAMERVLAALSDIPRASELTVPYRRLLQHADGTGPDAAPPRSRSLTDRLLEIVLPDGLDGRRRWCRQFV